MEAKNIVIANKLRIGVKNIRNISKGGVIMECDTSEDTDKIINAIKSHSNEIIATKPIKKKPKIAIYGVSEEFSDHDIIDELIEKNEAIKTYLACVNSEDIDQEIKIKFKFRRNNKISTANTWVLEINLS
jgi:hypothetical protein